MNADPDTDEFIDDQPPIGVLTDDARESLRLAIESTPDNHPDKPNMRTTISTIERGARVIIYRARYYKLAGEIVSTSRGLCVVLLDDGRVIHAYTADLELA